MGEVTQDKAKEPGFGVMFWVVLGFLESCASFKSPFPRATYSFLCAPALYGYYKKSVYLKVSVYAYAHV